MRHQVTGKKFSRTTNQRKALFLGIIRTLIERGSVTTTLVKAKAVKRVAEKLITTAKKGDLAARRRVLIFLREKNLTNRLVDEIAPVFKERKGGYLRIIRLSQRLGDNALMAKLEFVSQPQPDQRKKDTEVKAEGESALRNQEQKSDLKKKASKIRNEK